MQELPHSGPGGRAVDAAGGGRLLALMIFAVTLIGGGLLLGGYLFELSRGGQSLAIERDDRQVLLTAADLVEFAPGLVVRTDAETIRKVRRRDGSHHLAYTYQHPDGSLPLRIGMQVVVVPEKSQASAIFDQLNAANHQAVGELAAAFQIVPAGATFAWGDRLVFELLRRDDNNAGLLLTARHGQRIVSVRVVGVALSVEEAVGLLQPLLARVDDYEP